MDQLFALPIKGESFLYRRGNHHVLIDGGWSGTALAGALRSYAPNLSKVDVAVCTHGDKDHAGGLATILDHWRAPGPGRDRQGVIGQFWLPGSWVDVLLNLVTKPSEFVSELIAELQRIAKSRSDLNSDHISYENVEAALDEVVAAERWPGRPDARTSEENDNQMPNEADNLDEYNDIDLGSTEPSGEQKWFTDLRGNAPEIRRLREFALRAFKSGRRRIRYRVECAEISGALGSYWVNLIHTAENIRMIAENAILHRIRIRWFDFDKFAYTRHAQGGVRGFLVPLNSIEQMPKPRVGLSLLAMLSPINEGCLAFYAPETRNRLGFVFCGDSPLGDGQGYSNPFPSPTPRPLGPVVATAPHHGSESNHMAYTHLARWACVLSWIRTGGSHNHPGPTFKRLQPPQRICTHCPQMRLRLQPVLVQHKGLPPNLNVVSLQGHRCVCP